jgi:dTDP-4-dehydrorhamnose 3,5-epimerase
MIFEPSRLEGAFLIRLDLHYDDRGAFARTMCEREMTEQAINGPFVQQNISLSTHAGTIRGMHFQKAPHAEGKLIRCVRGGVHDVIVDARRGSPTYLQHQAYVLDDHNKDQLYIPPGFAHGFQTLVDDVEVTYLMTDFYKAGAEAGFRFDDPMLAIDWPLSIGPISQRDACWPLLAGAAIPMFALPSS